MTRTTCELTSHRFVHHLFCTVFSIAEENVRYLSQPPPQILPLVMQIDEQQRQLLRETRFGINIGSANGTLCEAPPPVDLDEWATTGTLALETKQVILNLYLNAIKRIVVSVEILPDVLMDAVKGCQLTEDELYAIFPVTSIAEMKEKQRLIGSYTDGNDYANVTLDFDFTLLNGELMRTYYNKLAKCLYVRIQMTFQALPLIAPQFLTYFRCCISHHRRCRLKN